LTVGHGLTLFLPPPMASPIPSGAAQDSVVETAAGIISGEDDTVKRLMNAVGVSPPPTAGAALGTQESHSLQTRQFWEGTVESVGADDFVAIVRDRTQTRNPDEEVVFALDEITAADRPLVSAGATFYWFIGPEYTPAGTQKNVSLIQFRRVPRWSRSAVQRAKARVQRFVSMRGPSECFHPDVRQAQAKAVEKSGAS
jgi:hypothetical protein